MRVRTFDDAAWQMVLDAFAAAIGHTAALLDGELPPEVAADAAGAGFDLLPGPGEIQPRCSCPDWADPCKHAAAVCYLVADELDADPFGILLLRGRTRSEILAGLRQRRAAPSDDRDIDATQPADVTADRGVAAAGAWKRTVEGVPAGALGRDTAGGSATLPLVPLPPSHPGRPPLLAGEPPAGAGVDPAGLRAVAADAAARALHLAEGGTDHGLDLPLHADLARRAAALVGPTAVGGIDLGGLAARAGVPARQLLRRALAWQAGGVGALDALDDQWDPGPVAMAEGRQLLGSPSTTRRNRVTAGDAQIRLGRDGCWYRYRRASDGGWDPDGPGVPAAGDARRSGAAAGADPGGEGEEEPGSG